MAAVGLDVTLHTSNPEKGSLDVAVEDCNGQTFFGHLARITEDHKVAAACELGRIYDNYQKLQDTADSHFPLDAETFTTTEERV